MRKECDTQALPVLLFPGRHRRVATTHAVMHRRTLLLLFCCLASLSVLAAEAPHVLFLIGDSEYKTGETVPAWARAELEPRGFRCTFLIDDFSKPFDQPALLALADPDLKKRPAALFISIKRRALPAAQMEAIAAFAKTGPVLGIRTASHAFGPKKLEPGEKDWVEFDRDVFGGDYENHYGKGPQTVVERDPKNSAHPILTALPAQPLRFPSHLYRCRQLLEGTEVLLTGTLDKPPGAVQGQAEIREPVAWLYKAPQHHAFYTSLGSPEDFAIPAFRRLLLNATLHVLGQPIPPDRPAK